MLELPEEHYEVGRAEHSIPLGLCLNQKFAHNWLSLTDSSIVWPQLSGSLLLLLLQGKFWEKWRVIIPTVSVCVIERADLLWNEDVHNLHSPSLNINVTIQSERLS
jgi:hypothetical protein